MVEMLPVLLVFIGTFVGSIGTVLIKKGTNHHPLRKLFGSKFFWGGVLCYGVSTVLYVLALHKEELTVVYPLVSMAYIWTTLFSVTYLKEQMNAWKGIAVAGIILGVILIGIGS